MTAAEHTAGRVGEGRRRARVFAHRGASAEFAEHTRAAYRQALAEDADGLEIDVRLSRDGEVVCFHDATVDRTSDGSGAVAEKSLAELRALDVHSWRTASLPAEHGEPGEQLMTLHDTLELLVDAGRDVALAVELKDPSPVDHRLEEQVLQVLRRHGWDSATSTLPGRAASPGAETEADAGADVPRVEVSFMSFHPAALEHLARTVPAERLCALFNAAAPRRRSRSLRRLAGWGRWADVLRPVLSAMLRRGSGGTGGSGDSGGSRDAEPLVWTGRAGIAGPGLRGVRRRPEDVRTWLSRGTTLRVWTVDDPADAAWLLGLGVQEMTTNHPRRIIAAVTGEEE